MRNLPHLVIWNKKSMTESTTTHKIVVEKANPVYGRACMLACRSVPMLMFLIRKSRVGSSRQNPSLANVCPAMMDTEFDPDVLVPQQNLPYLLRRRQYASETGGNFVYRYFPSDLSTYQQIPD
jgi:hypothetical protein